MDVRLLDDAGTFAELSAACLATDPFTTNVIGVQLDGVRDGRRPAPPGSIWIAVLDAGSPAEPVVGVGMHTPPHHLFLSRMPPRAASDVAGALHRAGWSGPGVNGESTAVAEFAAAWSERTGAVSITRVTMRMYVLGVLASPAGVPGASRLAVPADLDVVTAWFTAFSLEAQPHAPPLDLAQLASRRLAAGELHLWIDDDGPVSLAGISAAAAGVARVGPVYTPVNRRRHGYGAAVTAAASAAALQREADHAVLYTDLSNPTSNAIYQAIGYQPHHDAEERSLVLPG